MRLAPTTLGPLGRRPEAADPRCEGVAARLGRAGRFVIENCWPIPDADGESRGVVLQGPVASRWLARFRVLRYEVRRWRDGIIADVEEAVASPQPLSHDPVQARRLLELVDSLPNPVWGRDERGTGDMWNSNSVIAWLLARSGLAVDEIRPPGGWPSARMDGGPGHSPPAIRRAAAPVHPAARPMVVSGKGHKT